MKIMRFEQKSVNILYDFLSGRPGILNGLTRSYIWENTQPGYFIGTYYTLSKTNRDIFSNIFYKFGSKDGNVIEEWYSSGEDYGEAIRSIAMIFDSNLYFNLCQMSTGNELGWTFHSKRLEMTMATQRVRNILDNSSYFEKKHLDQVVKILSQEWWNKEQATQFMSVTSSNPLGVSRVILSGINVVAFGHAAYDEKQAWINTVYVCNQFRGKGLGRKITEGVVFELYKRGVEKVNLGVGEDNKEAIKTYQDIGFNFTSFIRYRFKVT